MKIKEITFALLTLMMTQTVRAEYTVFYPLKDSPLKFVVNGIDGTIKFDKATIKRGESSNIVWNYKYVSKIDIAELGSYNDISGSISVNPIKSRLYNVTVHNGNNYKDENLYLTVIQPDPEITFIADRYKIGAGESVNLSWDVKNIDSASIDNNVGTVSNKSTITVKPDDDTTYKLTAKGYFGEKEKSQLLTIDVIKNSVVSFLAVNKNKFTVGDSALFNWSVTGSEHLELYPYGSIDVNETSASVLLNQIGNFDYTLKSTSFNNSIQSSNVIAISVYNNPTISSFTVNNKKTIDVESGDDLKFDWVTKDSEITKLDGSIVSGITQNSKALNTNKTYTLEVVNGAGKSIIDNVIVNVVEPAVISSFSAPSIVFNNTPFVMNWIGTGITKYELSGQSGSGISDNEDMSLNTNKSITPTSAGNYTYTLKATNLAEKSITSTTQVVVENDPTLASLTVNGQSAITVASNTALNFLMVGASSGATIQGRNNDGTESLTLPSVSSATSGTTNYYASSFKTLNSISRYSPVSSVSVTVVDAPIISSINAPTPVFSGSAFTMTWASNNAINYKIKSNNPTSGIPTSDIDLDTTTTKSITPTTAGTYVYTITAKNAAGVTSTKTATVVVEGMPTFTNFTVNDTSSITVSPSTSLKFEAVGFSSGATLQARNSAGTANDNLPTTASDKAGVTTYYASAVKVLNGVTNYSALRSVSVVVVDKPIITSITVPSTVFSNVAFTMSWVATDSINYKIKSNNANSGVPTTDVDLLTATSKIITPLSAGNYVYTITATNSVGVSSTKTTSVSVTNSYLRILNPQSSSGIYNVTDGKGGSMPVYVNMTMDGGHWLLINRWIKLTSTAEEKTFNNVVVNGQNLSTATIDAVNYPVIPSGYTNSSSRAMYTSSNTGWTDIYGAWQSFNTFSSNTILGSNGFSANTPVGTKTFYAVTTGWVIDGVTTAPMSTFFGLWTAYGNSGACGGADIVTPNRICGGLSYLLQEKHLDSTSVKSLYIKASN